MTDVARYLGRACSMRCSSCRLSTLPISPNISTPPEGMAELKIAVRHAGATIGECTDVQAGVYPLPGNKQRPQSAPRGALRCNLSC